MIKLTRREKEVEALILEGKNQKQIMTALDIKPSTVKLHVKNIADKYKITQGRCKMKAIIKKVTGKKFLRWRNSNGHLYETATGTSVRLCDIENVDSYIIVDQNGKIVNEMIREKVVRNKWLKGR